MNPQQIDFNSVSANSGTLLLLDAPDLEWQRFAPKLFGNLSFQFSHASFLADEHEQALAELAARLEAAFNVFFKTKGLH